MGRCVKKVENHWTRASFIRVSSAMKLLFNNALQRYCLTVRAE